MDAYVLNVLNDPNDPNVLNDLNDPNDPNALNASTHLRINPVCFEPWTTSDSMTQWLIVEWPSDSAAFAGIPRFNEKPNRPYKPNRPENHSVNS